MKKECGKCHGNGGREVRVSGGRSMWGGRLPDRREWKRCDVCNGSGTNPDYRTKSCRNCWNTIEYSAKTDSSKVPDLCPSCREKARSEKNRQREARQYQPRREERPRYERPRQDDKWQEKPCQGLKGESGCSSRSTIRYRTDWNRIPDLCPACIAKIKARKAENEAKWREKPCKRCSNPVKYNTDWSHPPELCKSCLEKAKAEWQEQPCKGCGATIRYNVNWAHPPNYCKTCKENRPQRHYRNEIPDRNDNADAGSIPGFKSGTWDEGKVFGDPETGTTTHLHRHKDGTTISTFEDDELKGRYNFDTGEDETPGRD